MGSLRLGLFLAALGTAVPAPAPAQQCDAGARSGPVTIVSVATARRVREYAATVRGSRVLRRDAQTVIFADGRVVTADLAGLSRHLNALGWAHRPIQIVGSFSRRSARVSPG